MSPLLAVSGSPSADSRTALVTSHVVRRLAHEGHDVRLLDIRSELPAADLFGGGADSHAVRQAVDEVAAARGLIVATPVYKASYTGVLKAFLDLLPQSALAGKTVLPLATGGTVAHQLTIDYALRPVLSALGARHVVAGCFLLDTTIERQPGGQVRLQPASRARLVAAVEEFVASLPAPAALTAAR